MKDKPIWGRGIRLPRGRAPLSLQLIGLGGGVLLLLGLTLWGCSKKTLTAPDARGPVIAALTATPKVVGRGETTLLFCSAQDPYGDSLSYTWSATTGTFLSLGKDTLNRDSSSLGYARWKAPDTVANASVTVTVSDNRGNRASKMVAITMSVYRLVARWGSQGSDPGQFTSPNGIAVNPTTGNVYVADAGNNRIQKFDANGTFLKEWTRGEGDTVLGHPNLKNPRGVAVDRVGNVYVADTGNRLIQKFIDTGTNIFFSQTFCGLYGDTFGRPNAVAVTNALDFYVTDYDPDGNGRVWKFPFNDTLNIRHWYASSPGGVAADNYGYVYVPSGGVNKVLVFGTFTGEFGTPGDSTGEFNGPFGAAADDSNNVFITDAGNHRVQKFRRNSDNTFSFRTMFGSLGSVPNAFNMPLGIAVGPDYSVYVMDAGNYQVKKFSMK